MKKSYSTWSRGVLVACILMLATFTFAQNRITGKVSDGDGNVVPGATILEKGTNNGVVSDADGNYAITAAGAGTLVVSSVGYKTLEVLIGNQTVLDIVMESETASLNEVVVTGYQRLRQSDISGAASVLDMEPLKSVKASSFTQNLAGRAPGITISTSGAPGDATNVRIRGISSFGNNSPLYIIDGVPVQDQYQNSLNPEDIESMQVLKDASMASIYGSRGTNGVIVITTKRGKTGPAKLNYSGSFGLVNSVKGYDQVMNTSSNVYAQAMKKKFPDNPSAWYSNPSSLPKYIEPATNTIDEKTYDILNRPITLTNQTGTNWWDLMTRTGKMHDHTLSVTGGNDFATFFVSGGYMKQEGVLNNNYFNRGTFRANSDFKLTKSIRIGENLMYAGVWGVNLAGIGGSNNEQGVIGEYLKSTPIISQYDIKGNPGGHLTSATGNFKNPDVVLRENLNNNNRTNRVLGNIYGEIDVFTGVSVRSSFGIDAGGSWNRSFNYPEAYKVGGDKENNSFSEKWNNSFAWNWTNTAQFNATFNETSSFSFLLGQEAISIKSRNITGIISNYFTTDVNAWYLQSALANPDSRSIDSGGSEHRLASLFAKADLSIADKYLFSGTIRRDGSSKFLTERYGIFPAMSVGWRVSEESFLADALWLSDLKLRASYGEMGNQDTRDYNYVDRFNGLVGGTFYDIDGDNGVNGGISTGYALTSRGNPATVWGTSKTTNAGLDLALFNNSISLVVDVYKRNTVDLLYDPPLPGTAGSAEPPVVNVAAMENKGFDIGLGLRKSLTENLSINTTLNVSRYKNKIVKVADNVDEFPSKDNLTERFPQGSSVFINRKGYPISSFQGFIVEGIIKTEAERAKHTGTGAAYIGGLKFKDVNNDGVINQSDNAIIGNPHPDFTAGWNFGLTWKKLDLNTFLFGSFGNDIFNATLIQSYFMNLNSNVIKDILQKEGTGNYPKINGLDASSRSASTFYVEDGSYVRLANLMLGYRNKNYRVYLQGQNLFTFTKYSGVDPAVSNANIGSAGNVNDLRTGYDNGNYPTNKIMTIGINLNF
jgi:TonB-dependent starch-binding outer membrane protein SusC